MHKRLKLKHGYHDATIRSVTYRDGGDIAMEIDLCSCCNPAPGPALLQFLSVRNLEEVRARLDAAAEEHTAVGWVDEIVGIYRHETTYLLELATAGRLEVQATGILEA